MIIELKSARYWAEEYIRIAVGISCHVVDATMGNGKDTLMLCELVGESGSVVAFDVQPQAVANTQVRIDEAGYSARCRLICDGHQNVIKYINYPLDAAVFNLGWLPGANREITTMVKTTLKAVSALMQLIKKGGIITICAYPGHEEGTNELNALKSFLEALDSKQWSVLHKAYINQPNCPPQLFVLQRNT